MNCVSFSEASLTVKFSSHGEKQEPVVLLWQEYVIKVRTTFQFNGFLLRMVKVALTLLFVTWKYTRIVYRNVMTAECKFLNFVIVILTVSLFCIALF